MHRLPIASRAALLTLTLIGGRAVGVQAAPPFEKLLERVPETTAALVMTPSMDKLASRVAEFGRASGIDDLARMTADRMLEDVLDARSGLDTSGPLALLLLTDDSDAPSLIACIKDEAAWKKAADARPAEGAAAEFLTFEWRGEMVYASIQGEFVIVGATLEELKTLLRPGTGVVERLKSAGAKVEGGDVIGFVSIAPWRDLLAQGLDSIAGMLEMGMQMTAQDGQNMEQVVAMSRFFVDEARKATEQTQYLFLSAGFGPDGLNFAGSCHFAAESDVSRWLARAKIDARDALRGLPDVPMTFACGLDWPGIPSDQSMTERMTKVMFDAMPPEKREKHAESLKSTLEFQRMVTGVSGMFSIPDAGKGAVITLNYFTPEPAKATRLALANSEFGMAMASGMSPDVKLELKRHEEKIAGQDVVVSEMIVDGTDPRIVDALKQVYGEKFGQAVAAAPEGAVVIAGAIDSIRPTLEKALDKKAPQFAAGPRVAAARKRISPDPAAIGLADLGGVIELVAMVAAREGQPVPGLRKPAMPVGLIVGAAYFAPRAVRCELFVPADAIKAGLKIAEDAGKPAEASGPAPM